MAACELQPTLPLPDGAVYLVDKLQSRSVLQSVHSTFCSRSASASRPVALHSSAILLSSPLYLSLSTHAFDAEDFRF